MFCSLCGGRLGITGHWCMAKIKKMCSSCGKIGNKNCPNLKCDDCSTVLCCIYHHNKIIMEFNKKNKLNDKPYNCTSKIYQEPNCEDMAFTTNKLGKINKIIYNNIKSMPTVIINIINDYIDERNQCNMCKLKHNCDSILINPTHILECTFCKALYCEACLKIHNTIDPKS
jgi:hypothetical protein